MKISTIVLLLSIATLTFAAGRGISLHYEPTVFPHMILSNRIVKLQDVALGESAEASINLQNAGTSRLLIQNIMTSCGCTSAKMLTRVLPPGATEALRITITPTTVGIKRQHVIVQTNDPDAPEVVISVELLATPRIVDTPRAGSAVAAREVRQ